MPLPASSFFSSRRLRTLAENFWLGAVVAAVCVFYFWTASSNPIYFNFRGEQNDYYNKLSHGFLEGHLHMKVAPAAEKAREADALGLGNLPFLLDASFYQGKYFLYFGPAPVVLVFLPYRLLTGGDISDNFVAAAFACGGFLASLWLLRLVRRRFFPAAPGWMMPLFAALLGFGNGCAVMLRHPMFYEATIACAYFFSTLALYGIYRALTGAGSAAWLAAASLAFGLAVGARANFAFGSLVFGVVLAWFWLQRENRPVSFSRLLAAAAVPLGFCAAGLLAYNYLRFGNPLEFGVSYQFTYRPVFSPRFLPHNLKLYYGSLPELSPYFPFTLPIDEGVRPPGYVGFEQIHGQAWSVAFMPVVAIAAGLVWSRRFAAVRVLGIFYAAVLAFYVHNLVVLLCLGGRANRYLVDFQPAFLLAAAIGVMICHRELAWSRAWQRVAAAGLIGATALIALHNIFSSLQLYELFKSSNPRVYEPFATMMNSPTQWTSRWLESRIGPIRMNVRFPAAPKDQREPLLVAGSAEYCEFVLVHYLEPGRVRFVFIHYNYPELVSEPVAVATDRRQLLEIDLGALYPPAEHPFFRAFGRGERRMIRRNLQISLDHEVVFSAQHDMYDVSPARVRVGENPFAPLYSPRRFSGTISEVRRVGAEALLGQKTEMAQGPVVLRLRFPAEMAGGGAEPLLVTGENGRGDAVFVCYEDARHVRFGCDRWGGGTDLSGLLELDPKIPHTVEIWMGSLFPTAAMPRLTGLPPYQITLLKTTARVKLDGREVFRSPGPFHEADPASVDFGSNFIGLSSCKAAFSGVILEARRVPLPAVTGQEIAMPTGAVRLRVIFPTERIGHTEPLLTTGRTGSGDVVSVNYVDAQHVRFALDHWGAPPVVSAPVAVNYALEHEIDLELGSLLPPEDPANPPVFSPGRQLRNQVRVRIDGHEAFKVSSELHPVSAEEVGIGLNQIGASTTERMFTGTISRVEHPGGATRGSAAAPDFGAVVLELAFPKNRTGQSEPLLVTGRTGAGDALIVSYGDERHLTLTWDHWGAGGPSSAPIEIDFDEVHRIEISMGSLFPSDSTAMPQLLSPEEIARRRGDLEVKLDGRMVFSARGQFHPSLAKELRVGENPIGLSSAGPAFTGTIETFRQLGKN